MLITVVRSGGFCGMRRESAVNTDELPKATADGLVKSLRGLQRADAGRQLGRSGRPQQGRDRFSYQVTVQDGRTHQQFNADEELAGDFIRRFGEVSAVRA